MDTFKQKLDQHYAWPALYVFKFIVPKAKVQEVRNLFPLHDITERPSKNGNYTGLTIQVMVSSSDFIITIYQQAAQIEGLIAL